MYARAVVAAVKFGDSSLPKLDLTYVKPLKNALYDWAADALPLGPLTRWPSLIDGTELIGDGNLPNVYGNGPGRQVSLDGVSSRLRQGFTVSGPYTMVFVYRLTAPAANQTVDYGYLSSSVPRMTVSGSATSLNVTNGTNFIVPNPVFPPDTTWRAAVYSVDGNNSGLNINGQDTTGNMPLVARDGITLGFAAGNARTPIIYKRVAILSGGTTPAQRNAIVSHLLAHYGA